MTADRTEWLRWRRGGLGGSDIAAILGLSNYASPWSLWAEKTGLLGDPTDDDMTERQQIGLDLEPAIAMLFWRRTGLHVMGTQTRCTHPMNDWARCTVDGFVTDSDAPARFAPSYEDLHTAARLGGWEAKTDGRFSWPTDPDTGKVVIPANYQAQAQWGMWVTGLTHWWFAVLHAGFRFEVYELARDDDDIDLIVDRAEAFWYDHVLTGVPPEIDGSDATADALATVYADHQPGATADVPAELVEQWRTAAAQARITKAEAKRARNQLVAAIGTAEIGQVDGQPAVTCRYQTRTVTCTACGHTETSDPFAVVREAAKPKERT